MRRAVATGIDPIEWAERLRSVPLPEGSVVRGSGYRVIVAGREARAMTGDRW